MDFIKTLEKVYGICLSDQQKLAVTDIAGPMLLLSVPGGGKTTVIISRCANMVLNHGIAPNEILTLTFSKASAVDMKKRFINVFGDNVRENITFSTIHAFCYRLMKYFCMASGNDFPTIIEDDNHVMSKNKLLKNIYLEINKDYITEDKMDDLTSALSYCKNMMLKRSDIGNACPGIKNFGEIYDMYERYKEENIFIDFDDLLIKTYELLSKNEKFRRTVLKQFKYINIDESQDNSFLQHELIRLIASPSDNLFMVGDEDQSIYGFRGAFPNALLDFKKIYPHGKVLLMERNYRSTGAITNCASKFIRQNKNRYDKNMVTKHEQGEAVAIKVFPEREDQYEYIIDSLKKNSSEYKSKAVLFRNNISAIALMDCLEQSGIKFQLRDRKLSFFKHWILTDVFAFYDLSERPDDIDAFSKIYFKLNAFLSRAVLQYVIKKSAPGKNVFDIVLSYPQLNADSYDRIALIREIVKKLSKLHPAEMIDAIENGLGYLQYLAQNSNGTANPQDGFKQILNALKTIALSCKTVPALRERIGLLAKTATEKSNQDDDILILSTVHASKGLEFDRVFLIDMHDGVFPAYSSMNSGDKKESAVVEEEARLFYVGLTRAKKKLDILSSQNISGQKARVSRFVVDLMSLEERKKYYKPLEKMQGVTMLDKKSRGKKNPAKIIELYIDKRVFHETFGEGYISSLDCNRDIVEIHFNKYGEKQLSIRGCFSMGLLNDIDGE